MSADEADRPIDHKHPIILVRHGETDWNLARRLQGQEDIPLNDRGRGQGRRHGMVLREHFRARGLDPADHLFIASPLSRAAGTMRILRSALGLDPERFTEDPRLMELAFGRWAGLHIDQVAVADPAGHAAREADRWNARPPGGESMADGAMRVRPLLEALDRPAVLVTHGGLIRVMHHLLGAADRSRASKMTTPQDRFHVLDRGTVEWL